MQIGRIAVPALLLAAAVALGACAPAYEGYDPYAHPNTTARYLNNRNSYYYGPPPAYGDPYYRPRYYYPGY